MLIVVPSHLLPTYNLIPSYEVRFYVLGWSWASQSGGLRVEGSSWCGRHLGDCAVHHRCHLQTARGRVIEMGVRCRHLISGCDEPLINPEPRRSAVPAVPWCTAVPGVPGVPAVPRTRYTKPRRVCCTVAVPAVPLLYRCCTCCTAVPAVPHRKQAHVGHYKVHHTSHTPPPCLGRCTTMVLSIISWMVMGSRVVPT